MDEYEQELAGIERFASDEVFDELYSLATVLAEQLKAGTCTRAEAKEVVEELNKMIDEEHFHYEEAHVTGSVFIGGDYGDESLGIVPDSQQFTDFVDGAISIDRFELKTWTTIDDDGVSAETELVLGGWTMIDFYPDEDDEYSGEEEIERVSCVVPILPETQMSYEGMTPRRAERWLSACYPELQNDLVAALMQADDEAGALMNLKDIVVETTGLSRERRQELSVNMESYIDDVLNFDKYVPYLVELIGVAEVFNDEKQEFETKMITSQGKTLLLLNEIQYWDTDDNQLTPWLQGQLIGVKPGHASVIKLPLETIDSITAGRQFYRNK